MLIGAFDRRVRDAEDLTARLAGVPVLGLLPRLPKDLSDPEQVMLAAHCVHQIRSLLQIHAQNEDGQVFCITSPAARTGKTTLTVALGLSFSASHSRTLLIDCDLVGRSLSATANGLIKRRIERLIERGGNGNGDAYATADGQARETLSDLLEIAGSVDLQRDRFAWEWLSGVAGSDEEHAAMEHDLSGRALPCFHLHIGQPGYAALLSVD